jgi:ADP-heptose:LPS heptosyltransferase
MRSTPNRYLLFCSTGLGDSLFCTPAIRHLRRQDPPGEIIIVVKRKLANLFSTNPHINRIIAYRNNFFSMWRASRQLRSRSYRAIFFFHVGGEVVQLIRDTSYDELHCVQKLNALPSNAQLFPIDIRNKRQWEDFADMVSLVCGGMNADHEFELPLNDASRTESSRFYSEIPKAKWRIGIQLGGSHLGKCWPPKRFSEVATYLVKEHDAQIFVNATASEQPLWETFLKALSPEIRKRVNRLPDISIIGLAALLKELDLFISNDTGPLHVALSQQCPVIALKAHDEQTFAYTLPRPTPLRRSIFVKTDVPTSGQQYRESHRAMEAIPTAVVLRETEDLMRTIEEKRAIV